MDDDPDEGFASPPCLMHELDPYYAGLAGEDERASIKRWRRRTRERLIAVRMAILSTDRAAFSARMIEALDALTPDVGGLVVSTYWPFRGEVDLRPWMRALVKRGAITALPLVVASGTPLIFRAWAPGEPTVRGVWDIPVPVDEAPVVRPDIVIAPLVGFDPASYRLGYGGGFYDRTLASLQPKPRVFGVGFNRTMLSTIYPGVHDIAMDEIVTEFGVMGR